VLGLLHTIIHRSISSHLPCRRLVSSDGITTRNFTIDCFPGIYAGASIDAALSQRTINILGNTFGIAKNLDEYQLKICLKIPSIPDSDPVKLHLQKFRIGIIASFAALVSILQSNEPAKSLVSWNTFAAKLLRKTSDFFNNIETDIKPDDTDIEETFKFFQVPVGQVNAAIEELYS
jgi:hypothetical protein